MACFSSFELDFMSFSCESISSSSSFSFLPVAPVVMNPSIQNNHGHPQRKYTAANAANAGDNMEDCVHWATTRTCRYVVLGGC